MEKRVFLAIFLCFAVLAVYQAYFAPKPPEETAATAPAAQTTPSATPAATPAAAANAPTTGPAPMAPPAQALVADTAAHDIVVDTDDVRAVFTSQGAALKSWVLKKYRSEDGRELDLVPPDLPTNFPRPFTLATEEPVVSATLASALYQPSATTLTLGKAPGTLSFEYRDAS